MARRRRRRLPWILILWLLLIGNVAAGLWFSPATSPRRIRVEGAPTSLRPFIQSLLVALRDVPCARVDAEALETKVQALPGVRTASFRRNVFGSGTLAIEPFRPAAGIQGHAGLFLSDRGVLFRSKDPQGALPKVRPPEGFDEPHLAIAEPWESGTAARTCLLARSSGAFEGADIEECVIAISSSGSVSLYRGQLGPVIELGSSEQLQEKFEKIKELLSNNPRLFSEIKSLNITAINRPQIVSKDRLQSK